VRLVGWYATSIGAPWQGCWGVMWVCASACGATTSTCPTPCFHSTEAGSVWHVYCMCVLGGAAGQHGATACLNCLACVLPAVNISWQSVGCAIFGRFLCICICAGNVNNVVASSAVPPGLQVSWLSWLQQLGSSSAAQMLATDKLMYIG
jgi:hypothetical protein